MKFELDQGDVETILDALQERKHQLQGEIRHFVSNLIPSEASHLRELLNEVCVTLTDENLPTL
jgi:hypothetical protein